ncbi:ABC transporter permease [Phaeodactylibacter sp.]|uniref:ABC transporter permease n=1 Tax=Phaeodactylibacter sp. TaxID=1940289 RepID=UPI0025FB1609|nr:ABC transporter permease [Phaeodactylibacter sp.]MCI5092359.1 ABC transporter permease [Phaeodactylibacter sp.]
MRTFLRKIKAWWYLVKQLTQVEIIGMYKKSFLGMAWMFILPILAVIIWVVLNGAGVVNPGETDIPYPAYVLLSTSIWGFFLEAYKSASNLLTKNGRMLIMSEVPFEPLLTQKVVVHLINFIIPFAVNLIVLLAFGVRFSAMALLFPLSLIPLLLLGMAIGMVVAIFRVIMVDVANLVDEGMKLLMFLTPIVYTPKITASWLEVIVGYNPLTYLIGFSRDLLTSGTLFRPLEYLIFSGISMLLVVISFRFLLKSSTLVLERLINN